MSHGQRTVAVALLLLVGGVASVGWAYYQEPACNSGVGVDVERLDDGEPPGPEFAEVHFEDLSEAEREVFLEILNAETTPTYRNESLVRGLERKVVVYQGERYRTSPMWVEDCPEDW